MNKAVPKLVNLYFRSQPFYYFYCLQQIILCLVSGTSLGRRFAEGPLTITEVPRAPDPEGSQGVDRWQEGIPADGDLRSMVQSPVVTGPPDLS